MQKYKRQDYTESFHVTRDFLRKEFNVSSPGSCPRVSWYCHSNISFLHLSTSRSGHLQPLPPLPSSTHAETKNPNLSLRRNLQLLVLSIKHNILGPEHNITIDLDVRTAIALDPTEAGVSVDLGECDCGTRDLGHVGRAHSDGEVRERGVAGVGEAADLGVVDGTGYFGVIGCGDRCIDEEEGGSGV